MAFLNDREKLDLRKMVKKSEVMDTTDKIRKLRHSSMIKENVKTMLLLKKKYTRMSKEMLKNIVIKQCNFLYLNYTNIFNKLFKDLIDVELLFKFIDILRQIEDSEYDQHEASVKVGKILKQIYIDSALREDKQRNKHNKVMKKRNGKKLSWNDYKQLHNI